MSAIRLMGIVGNVYRNFKVKESYKEVVVYLKRFAHYCKLENCYWVFFPFKIRG